MCNSPLAPTCLCLHVCKDAYGGCVKMHICVCGGQRLTSGVYNMFIINEIRVCMCVYVYMHVHGMEHVWRSEDNLQKSVLSHHHVDSRSQSQAVGLDSKGPCLLSLP